MSFLYPAYLFGLLAVAIPVVIHLFNFQRPKTILFTNVRFLRNVQEITTSRVKLKHYLILLSRILFVIFLVLAFAQPFIKGKNAQAIQQNSSILLYLDNSYSMQGNTQDGSLLDVAVKAVSHLVEVYPLNSLFSLTTNDFEGKDQFFINKERVQERLSEVNYSYAYRNAQSIINRMQSATLHAGNRGNAVFLFSDFQKSTLGDLAKLKLDSLNQYFFVPIHNEYRANVVIDSVWLPNPMVRENESNLLEAKIYNAGKEEVKDRIVKLYIDEVQHSSASVTIAPNSYQTIQMNFNVRGTGQKSCRLAVEDAPVVFDNNYYFVVAVSPKVNVLHLYETSEGYGKKIYANPLLFQLTSRSINDFDYGSIPVASLIVLENIKQLPASLITSLEQYVKKGGSVVLIPAAGADLSSYNQLSSRMFLPEFKQRNSDTTSQQRLAHTMTVPDFNHPFFKNIFEKEDKAMSMPYAYPSLDIQNKGETLLQLKNGESFLSVFRNNTGKVYLFSTAFNDTYTNFPRHALVIPVMYKIAFESMNNAQQLAYSIQGGVVEVELPENIESSEVLSLSKQEYSILPEQSRDGKKLRFSIPNIGVDPGVYALKWKNQLITKVALNNGKLESLSDTYTQEELQNITKSHQDVHIYQSEDAEHFIKTFKEENIGISLWKYCLICSLLFLLAEVLLIRFL